jgi:hypothetical protein
VRVRVPSPLLMALPSSEMDMRRGVGLTAVSGGRVGTVRGNGLTINNHVGDASVERQRGEGRVVGYGWVAGGIVHNFTRLIA